MCTYQENIQVALKGYCLIWTGGKCQETVNQSNTMRWVFHDLRDGGKKDQEHKSDIVLVGFYIKWMWTDSVSIFLYVCVAWCSQLQVHSLSLSSSYYLCSDQCYSTSQKHPIKISQVWNVCECDCTLIPTRIRSHQKE